MPCILFETMGLLLGKTGLAPTDQQNSLAQVVSPHIRSMEQTLQSDFLQRDPESCGERLAASIAAIAYLSKGFKDPPVEVQLVLAETISITLSVLEALPENDDVRSKTFVLLQRMILCIRAKLLPTMPRFLLLLIEHCTTDDIQDVAQLLNQLCIKFGADAIPAIDPALLPFLRKCHELVPSIGEVVATASACSSPFTNGTAVRQEAYLYSDAACCHVSTVSSVAVADKCKQFGTRPSNHERGCHSCGRSCRQKGLYNLFPRACRSVD